MNLRHEFVEYMPDEITEGVLYISIPFGTMIHKCACGCGEEVVTPLGPAEWRFSYNGKTISICPSVGNWSLRCRSHYWIEEGHVRWARSLTMKQVLGARTKTKKIRQLYFTRKQGIESSETRTRWHSYIKELFAKILRKARL